MSTDTRCEVTYEQIGSFMFALLDHVPSDDARRAVLAAARDAFELRFPTCGAVYRPGELAFPPVCVLPFGHGGEYHDPAPDSTFSDRWIVVRTPEEET